MVLRLFIACLIIAFTFNTVQAGPPDHAKKHKKHHKHKKAKDKYDDDHDDDDDDDDDYKKGRKGKKHYNKKFTHDTLPHWARDCGLPPGLAKQNKIPPGWEKKCRSGKKYYDNEDEFKDAIDYRQQKKNQREGKGSSETVYVIDETDCKVQAMKNAGGVGEGVAKGVIFGGVLGALGGAVLEGVQENGNIQNGAIYGGAGGAAGGAVLGGILGSDDYKDEFRKCMKKRGHKVD